MKSLYTFLILTLPTLLIGQTAIGEGVKTKLFYDDFMEKTDKWPTETSKTDIYLNYDDGDYIISRKNSEKPYAVQPNFSDIKRNFLIKASFELAPSNPKDASLGLFVMLQQGLSGGYIFEINGRDRIRVKELLPNGFKYLTGDERSEGWMKNDFVRRENKLEVKAYAGTYEFYCNDKLVKRTVNKNYQEGFFGTWVGSEALGKMDYYYVYDYKIEGQPDIIKSDIVEENKRLKLIIDSLQSENSRLKIADPSEKPGAEMAIMVLEKRISQLQGENRGLQAQVDKIKNSSEAGAIDLIDKMTAELSAAAAENDSLTELNRELIRKYDICQERFFNLKDQYDSLLNAQNSIALEAVPTDSLTEESIKEEKDVVMENEKTPAQNTIEANESLAQSVSESDSSEQEKTKNTEAQTLMETRRSRAVKKAQLEIR